MLAAILSVALLGQAAPAPVPYRSAEGAFAVTFPAPPEALRPTAPIAKGARPSTSVHLRQGQRLYLVSSLPTRAPLTFTASLDALAGVASGFIANSRLIGPPEDVKAGELLGKQYFLQRLILAIGQPTYFKFRVFVTGDRIYQVVFAAHTEQEARTAGDAFLSSFAPIDPAPFVPETVRLPADWKRVALAEIGASVRLPADGPKERPREVPTAFGTFKARDFGVPRPGLGVFTISAIDLTPAADLPAPDAILDAFARILADGARGPVRARTADGPDLRLTVDAPKALRGQDAVVYARLHLEGKTLYQLQAIVRPGFELEPISRAYLDSLSVP